MLEDRLLSALEPGPLVDVLVVICRGCWLFLKKYVVGPLKLGDASIYNHKNNDNGGRRY